MNKTQRIVANLMAMSSFNDFDGVEVVKSLEANSDYWRGFIWGRFDGFSELIPLRDIEDDSYNADTLYLLPAKGKERELELLAKSWQADEVDYIGGEDACKLLGSYSPEGRSNECAILRVWWD